jgi:hypothetical protein
MYKYKLKCNWQSQVQIEEVIEVVVAGEELAKEELDLVWEEAVPSSPRTPI